MEAILSKFASKMRRIAPSDPLIQATGVSAFIQTVLVPELTVMLVKEDMNVDAKTARMIIQESMAIGELVNEMPDDIVHVDESDMDF